MSSIIQQILQKRACIFYLRPFLADVIMFRKYDGYFIQTGRCIPMAYKHKSSSFSENEFKYVPITDPEIMSKYFDYGEIREVIRKDTKKITDVLENTSRHDDVLLQIIQIAPQGLLKTATCQNCFLPVDVEEAAEDSRPLLYTMIPEALEAFLETSWKTKKWDKTGELLNSVRKVTYEGTVNLTADQAWEVLLFCGLFGTVQHIPEEADKKLLAGYLQLKPEMDKVLEDQNEILLTQEETVLPFCSSKHTVKSWQPKLSVINNTMEEAALVKLEDCCLQRHLESGEKCLVLTRKGRVVAFLSRFCVSDGQLILQEGSAVCAYADGSLTDTLELPEDDPVVLGESRRFGLLMVDRKGSFRKDLLKNNFRGSAPEKPVFWLRGDLEDYGFVTGTAKFLGHLPREAWNNICFFDISVGKGVAVTAGRKAIDGNGQALATDVAEVSCCGDRWIVLRTDGTVCTDGSEIKKPDFPARAVCADDSGYWIATDHRLYRLTDTESCLEESVEEFARSNDGATVYGRLTDGSYLQLH